MLAQSDAQRPIHSLLAQTEPIPRRFFERRADLLAPDLISTVLVHGEQAGMLVETEAYLGSTDLAAHAFRGLTERTKIMFGPPGFAYVYLIYGMYECLNVVADTVGSPHCVLVRALEPLAGIDQATNGPGKLTRAMNITRSHYGVDLTTGPLQLRRWKRKPKFAIEVTPRVGIKDNIDWPLRFTWAHNPHLSRIVRNASSPPSDSLPTPALRAPRNYRRTGKGQD